MTKLLKVLGGVCAGAGFFFMLGIVGSIECSTMPLMPGVFLAMIGLAVMGVGCFILNAMYD